MNCNGHISQLHLFQLEFFPENSVMHKSSECVYFSTSQANSLLLNEIYRLAIKWWNILIGLNGTFMCGERVTKHQSLEEMK